MDREFDPVVELQPEEVAQLAAIINHPGFKVYNKVWKGAVDGFVIPLLNTPLEDEARILKLHMAAQIVAKLFATVVERVNEEVDQHIASRPSERPLDVTENLDMGGVTTLEQGEEPLF